MINIMQKFLCCLCLEHTKRGKMLQRMSEKWDWCENYVTSIFLWALNVDLQIDHLRFLHFIVTSLKKDFSISLWHNRQIHPTNTPQSTIISNGTKSIAETFADLIFLHYHNEKLLFVLRRICQAARFAAPCSQCFSVKPWNWRKQTATTTWNCFAPLWHEKISQKRKWNFHFSSSSGNENIWMFHEYFFAPICPRARHAHTGIKEWTLISSLMI